MTHIEQKEKDQIKRFYKSRKDRMIDGVCAGFADYIGSDVTLVRILWLISIFINGIGVIAYLLMMIFVPVNPAHTHLKNEEKHKKNQAMVWGMALIIFGFFFLFEHSGLNFGGVFPVHFRFFPWQDFPWGVVWPLGLVILGIVYITIVLQKDKTGVRKKNNTIQATQNNHEKKLYRKRDDKLLGGVCGGIARYVSIDSTIIRVGFVLFALLTHVMVWIVLYILFIVIIPKEPIERTSTVQ